MNTQELVMARLQDELLYSEDEAYQIWDALYGANLLREDSDSIRRTVEAMTTASG